MDSPLFPHMIPNSGKLPELRIAWNPRPEWQPRVPFMEKDTPFEIARRFGSSSIVPFCIEYHHMSMVLRQRDINEAKTVASIDEAEDEVFNQGTTDNWVIGSEAPWMLIHRVISASSKIATATRRGVGNTMFIHDDFFQDLRAMLSRPETPVGYLDTFKDVPEEQSGRWCKKAVATGRINVYTTKSGTFAKDEIITCYVGQSKIVDGPGGLFVEDDGTIHVCTLQSEPNLLGSASDYVSRLKFSNLTALIPPRSENL